MPVRLAFTIAKNVTLLLVGLLAVGVGTAHGRDEWRLVHRLGWCALISAGVTVLAFLFRIWLPVPPDAWGKPRPLAIRWLDRTLMWVALLLIALALLFIALPGYGVL
jgi:hypothetical protein